MPALIADAGDDAARFTLEFFTARIPNRNTRAAYVERSRASVNGATCGPSKCRCLSSPTIAAYIEAPNRS